MAMYGCWNTLSRAEKESCIDLKTRPRDITYPLQRLKAWQVQGKLAEEGNRLKEEISLRTCDINFRTQISSRKPLSVVISWEVYLVGKDATIDNLKPSIVAECLVTKTAKKACKALESLKKRQLAPLLREYELHYTQAALQLCADVDNNNARVPDELFVASSLCGVQIVIESSSRSEQCLFTTSTIGGAIVLDGTYYAITTAHVFPDVTSTSNSQPAQQYGQHDANAVLAEIENDGAGSSSEHVDTNAAVDSRVLINQTSRIYVHRYETTMIDPMNMRVPDPRASNSMLINNSTHKVILNRTEDWALVPIENAKFRAPNIIRRPDGNEFPVHSISADDKMPDGPILVATGVSEPSITQFVVSSSLLLLPGSNHLQMVWKADKKSAPGDSGSWIVDAESIAHAMVVAARKDDDTIYCLPLAPIARSIKAQLQANAQPSLPYTQTGMSGLARGFSSFREEPPRYPHSSDESSLDESDESLFEDATMTQAVLADRNDAQSHKGQVMDKGIKEAESNGLQPFVQEETAESRLAETSNAAASTMGERSTDSQSQPSEHAKMGLMVINNFIDDLTPWDYGLLSAKDRKKRQKQLMLEGRWDGRLTAGAIEVIKHAHHIGKLLINVDNLDNEPLKCCKVNSPISGNDRGLFPSPIDVAALFDLGHSYQYGQHDDDVIIYEKLTVQQILAINERVLEIRGRRKQMRRFPETTLLPIATSDAISTVGQSITATSEVGKDGDDDHRAHLATVQAATGLPDNLSARANGDNHKADVEVLGAKKDAETKKDAASPAVFDTPSATSAFEDIKLDDGAPKLDFSFDDLSDKTMKLDSNSGFGTWGTTGKFGSVDEKARKEQAPELRTTSSWNFGGSGSRKSDDDAWGSSKTKGENIEQRRSVAFDFGDFDEPEKRFKKSSRTRKEEIIYPERVQEGSSVTINTGDSLSQPDATSGEADYDEWGWEVFSRKKGKKKKQATNIGPGLSVPTASHPDTGAVDHAREAAEEGSTRVLLQDKNEENVAMSLSAAEQQVSITARNPEEQQTTFRQAREHAGEIRKNSEGTLVAVSREPLPRRATDPEQKSMQYPIEIIPPKNEIDSNSGTQSGARVNDFMDRETELLRREQDLALREADLSRRDYPLGDTVFQRWREPATLAHSVVNQDPVQADPASTNSRPILVQPRHRQPPQLADESCFNGDHVDIPRLSYKAEIWRSSYHQFSPVDQTKRVSTKEIDPRALDEYYIRWQWDPRDDQYLYIPTWVTTDQIQRLRRRTARMRNVANGIPGVYSPRPIQHHHHVQDGGLNTGGRSFNTSMPAQAETQNMDTSSSYADPSRVRLRPNSRLKSRPRVPATVKILRPMGDIKIGKSSLRRPDRERQNSLRQSEDLIRETERLARLETESHTANMERSKAVNGVCRRLDLEYERHLQDMLRKHGVDLQTCDRLLEMHQEKERKVLQTLTEKVMTSEAATQAQREETLAKLREYKSQKQALLMEKLKAEAEHTKVDAAAKHKTRGNSSIVNDRQQGHSPLYQEYSSSDLSSSSQTSTVSDDDPTAKERRYSKLGDRRKGPYSSNRARYTHKHRHRRSPTRADPTIPNIQPVRHDFSGSAGNPYQAPHPYPPYPPIPPQYYLPPPQPVPYPHRYSHQLPTAYPEHWRRANEPVNPYGPMQHGFQNSQPVPSAHAPASSVPGRGPPDVASTVNMFDSKRPTSEGFYYG